MHVVKARALEAKARARTLKAKVKDMISFPRGFTRPRPVLEDYITTESYIGLQLRSFRAGLFLDKSNWGVLEKTGGRASLLPLIFPFPLLPYPIPTPPPHSVAFIPYSPTLLLPFPSLFLPSRFLSLPFPFPC
jgi:hypothetical protein